MRVVAFDAAFSIPSARDVVVRISSHSRKDTHMGIESKWVRAGVRRAWGAGLRGLWLLAPAALFSGCGGGDPAVESANSGESEAQEQSVAADCATIEAQLRIAELRVEQILEELQTTPPGPEHDGLLRQLRTWVARVNQLRAQLDRCRNPPPPRPDLVAVSVVTAFNLNRSALDAALLVRNDGQGAAAGPFNIVFGASIPGVFRQATFQVPSSVTLQPGGSYTSEFMRNIAAIRDAQGVATFRFDAIVDSDQVVPETNEGNNSLTIVMQDPVAPPDPPPQCPTNWTCCEDLPGGGCNQCIPPGSSCQ